MKWGEGRDEEKKGKHRTKFPSASSSPPNPVLTHSCLILTHSFTVAVPGLRVILLTLGTRFPAAHCRHTPPPFCFLFFFTPLLSFFSFLFLFLFSIFRFLVFSAIRKESSTCENGIAGWQSEEVCCAVNCGRCGGDNCASIEGTNGAGDCCVTDIREADVPCGVAPCIIITPTPAPSFPPTVAPVVMDQPTAAPMTMPTPQPTTSPQSTSRGQSPTTAPQSTMPTPMPQSPSTLAPVTVDRGDAIAATPAPTSSVEGNALFSAGTPEGGGGRAGAGAYLVYRCIAALMNIDLHARFFVLSTLRPKR